MAHVGLYVISHLGKTAFEIALNYYIKNAIFKKGQLLVNHVNSICYKEDITLLDNYAVRSQGYYNMEDAIKKIESADTELAKNITQLMYSLTEEDDFIIINQTDS